MEMKRIYDAIIQKCLDIEEKPKLEMYKKGIKDLRNSYKENICKPLYQDEYYRDCYMLAYFPYYCLLANKVVSKVSDYIQSKDLIVSIFGCGPAPEVVGVYEQFKNRNIRFNLFDYEYGWEEERKFTKNYIRNNFNNNTRFNEISGCDLLTSCTDCERLASDCKTFIKNTDVFIMQNCLNHITNEEDFKDKVSFIIDNAKNDSIFIFIDLNYDISINLMKDILDKNKKECQVLEEIKKDNIRIDKNNIPGYIKEYIFTGEKDLILKTNINYTYMILKKNTLQEIKVHNNIESTVRVDEKDWNEKNMEVTQIQKMSIEANELRKLEKYEQALELYETIEDKDENIISGMANCYRKLGKSDKSIKIINAYIKNNPHFNIDESEWFKIELVWSYRDYYLNKDYVNKENAIKAVNKILEYGEKDNEFLLRSIKNSIFTKEVIRKYPKELKNILDKIDGSENNHSTILSNSRKSRVLFNLGTLSNSKTLSKIKSHKMLNKNINTCIYYSIILCKMNVLLQLQDYQGVIDIYNIYKSLDDFHIERNMAKAVAFQGNYQEAISILNKAAIKFGKQFYIYSDIGEIYELMGDTENALKSYYKACLLVHDDKFLLSTLISISKLLVEEEKELARKHLDLCILLRKQEGWKLKSEEESLLKKLSECKPNNDIKILREELNSIWENLINKDVEIFEGIIENVLDSGNGFIRYDNGKKVFFRRSKNYNLKKDDKVTFTIEESYDRKKEVYSKAATNLKLIRR